MPATLSIVNSIHKPEMAVRLILNPPSGMSVNGGNFRCVGQCVAVYRVMPGDVAGARFFLQAIEPGNFDVTGALEWFFADQPDPVFRKVVVLSVEISSREEVTPRPTETPWAAEPTVSSISVAPLPEKPEDTAPWHTWLRNFAIGLGAFSGLLSILYGARRLSGRR